ncbi:AraC family transcriptional regulator [Variovorax paradoxus]|uniref:Transcriptional regulator, AraC family n=1 Tax=Variovorax paradoxus (strain EPS) TaxID=595537 RepID=E6V1N0_VARPE|nr:AraC family transcriptional regulator [Variovorax paradoxus]ADU36786.1 transcriptional regulator, AraC family [Variovorax paradoxus EPS]
MDAWSSQQLSPLYGREVFRSREADETHALVAHELKDHRSVWGRGKVDAVFCRAELSALSLCILRYGCDVDIEPDALGNFVLVQMPLRGHAEIRTGGQTLHIHPGQGAVVSAHKPVRLRWHADCEQLMLKIQLGRLQEVARRAFAARHADEVGEIDFDMPLRLDDAAGAQWCRMVANLASLLPAASDSSTAYDPRWLAHCEDNLMLYLLCHRPNSVRRQHDALRLGSEAASLGQLRRAEEFMRSRLDTAVSLEEVAEAAGVTRRMLALLFRRHRDLSPMEVLRNMRLDAAHAQLARHDGTSVTQIALDCGFSHLSRFAACYRERFGQLPRETSRH